MDLEYIVTEAALNSSGVTTKDLVARFKPFDYVIFSCMLASSAIIGLYFGCYGKKQDTKEFLMAGKSMTTFPVAMSLIASFMSAITLLGTPSEVYQNGFSYWLIGFSYFLVMPATAYLYFPVFWKLQVTSAYEYLEIRFSKPVRLMGSFIFIFQMTLYMAVVVYAPALALSQVTGIGVYVSVFVICIVCIFYTTLGGMKAVLWTDTLQVIVMYLSMIFIVIQGASYHGGFWPVWEAATRGNRTTLIDFDLNPTTRHTFWSLIFGGYFTWITIYGVNQAQIQRYLCVQEKYMVITALWWNMIGLFIIMIVCAFAGLVIYTRYEGCDPVKAQLIERYDQLLPVFVMDTLGTWTGLPGLFVAGIFSGALSTVSSGMNSLAAITLEDIVKGIFIPDISEERATLVSRILSLFFGVLTFALVFVAELLGGILSAALSIFGILGGPLLGVFTLGLFFPWANSAGAIGGTIFSLVFTLFIGGGYQYLTNTGILPVTRLPTDLSRCVDLNITIIEPMVFNTSQVYEEDQSAFLEIFKVSYLYYSAIACFSVIIVGLIISFITGAQNIRKLNPDTVSPILFSLAAIFPPYRNIGVDYQEDQQKLRSHRNGYPLGEINAAFNNSDGDKIVYSSKL